MFDLDKDWIPVILAVVTPAFVAVGWLVKTRREDRLTRELEWKTKELKYLAKIEDLQRMAFAWQQERIKDEENKRREVDVSNKLMLELTVLVKNTLSERDKG